MAKKNKSEKKESSDSVKVFESIDKTFSVERTLEELLFINVDFKDVDKLRKLRKINKRKHIDIIKKLKECIKEAL